MKQPAITFVINNNSYSLCATDAAGIRSMPAADRQCLIALLESVKSEEARSRSAVQNAVDAARKAPVAPALGRAVDYQAVKPERLGAGDADALMARLIAEENRNKKPGLTKLSIYKVFGGFAVVVFLLVILL
ncbi:MAG: hypothetical protein V7746_24025 [Halioglobus sp.]